MTTKHYIGLAALGSALLLGGAYVFQLLGYAPCKMCLWQRWPHGAAIVIGVVGLAGLNLRLTALLGAAAALTTAGIGIFHTGVERDWWEGPTSCSGGGAGLSGLSGESLLSVEAAPAVVMCDQVAWAFAGLSMASWNAVISLGLAAIWIFAATRPSQPV